MTARTPPAGGGAARPLWLRRGYLGALGGLGALAVVLRWLTGPSDPASLALVLTCLWALPLAAWSVRQAWRRLTYRVGVRLFLSYLLIGLTPFVLFAFVGLIAGYVLAGQYAAMRLRGEVDRIGDAMAQRTADAARALAAGRADHAREALEGGAASPAGLREAWLLADADGERRRPDASALPVPRWVPEGSWRGVTVVDGAAFLASVERRGARVAALLLPLDLPNARAFPRSDWYEVRFVTDMTRAVAEGAAGVVASAGVTKAPGGERVFRIDGRPVPETQVEGGWLAARPAEGTALQRTRVLWAWPAGTPRSLADGSTAAHARVFALLKLSPRGAISDLFGSSDRMAGEVKGLTATLAGVFVTIYAIAVSFAAVMILRVTRATARLTRGARAVGRGDFEHRIAVGRHDQLGELAASFNAMTGSVRSMLVQVAEKERMAKEVELAREIQSSLLPPAELASGPLAVWAHFRPAAEVGGDYFDFFPLAPGGLLVAIGDVAGHGLPTGLLMAMVKSAVATLVEEGYRGAELLTRLNRLLLAQSLRQRMVSLALAEADAARGVVRITSAGHQPGVLLASDGRAEEVLLSSLPLGHRWPDEPPTRALPFGEGARLLLYSDGLVEARDAAGVPFGHERLREVLVDRRGDDGPGVLRSLLAELDRWAGGQPLADDLTVVLVERRANST